MISSINSVTNHYLSVKIGYLSIISSNSID